MSDPNDPGSRPPRGPGAGASGSAGSIGKALGDQKLKQEGRVDQVNGKVQNAVGGLKDKLRERDDEE